MYYEYHHEYHRHCEKLIKKLAKTAFLWKKYKSKRSLFHRVLQNSCPKIGTRYNFLVVDSEFGMKNMNFA